MRKVFKFFLTILFFVIFFESNAQRAKLDSLLKELDNSISDSLRCEITSDAGILYRNYNLDSSAILLNNSLYICDKVKYFRRINYNYFHLAATYFYQANFQKSREIINEAFEKIQEDENNHFKGRFYNVIASIEEKEGNFQKAIEAHMHSIKILEENKDSFTLFSQYGNLANVYNAINDKKTAFVYAKKAVTGLRKINDPLYLAIALTTLISSYDTNSIQKKINAIDEVITIGEKNKLQNVLGNIYMQKAELFIGNDNKKALQLYEKAKYYNKLIGSKREVVICNLSIGKIHSKMGQNDLAEVFLENSLKEAKKLKMYKETEHSLKELGAHYKSIKNYKKAFQSVSQLSELIDSTFKRDLATSASEADIKYQTEQKEKQIAQQELEILKQKSYRNKMLGGGTTLLLLLGGVFLWNNERQKRKKKEAEISLKEKQLEAHKFKELDVMKNQFFTNITHELRTPLTLIMGPLDNALEKEDLPTIQKNILIAKNNTLKLLDMVNEILDLSKLESGNISVNLDQVNINQFFKRVFYSFQSAAEIQNITLKFSSEFEDKTGCSIDIEKVETILNNLISNAIKFSSSEDVIRMFVNKQVDNIRIKLQDNGTGIPENEQEFIFNRFYQASNTETQTQGGGTGVGLALSKSLVTLVGGTIGVESKLNHGSTFIINLPTTFNVFEDKKRLTPSIENINAHYEPVLINGEKPHILIIEDNREMQNYLKDILEEDYKISVAGDGYEGLRMLQTNTYDLISCDVMMPKMDGFTLKEKANELNIQSDIPFIFLTAKVLKEDKLRGLRLGVDDYISKPFDKNEYKARIYNLLTNRKGRLEYQSLNTDFALQNTESTDYQTLKSIEGIIAKNLSNTGLKVKGLAKEMHCSERQLGRLIKKLTGMSSVKFILELRLQRAHYLIKSKQYQSIVEVQDLVGIESSSYFYRKFKERFGVSPGNI